MPEDRQLTVPTRTGAGNPAVRRSAGGDTLADILERVLDKGVVIVGDVGINVLDIELLTLKIRLLVASADTAREMGIDWWTSDPFLSSDARRAEDETRQLRERVAELERALAGRSGEAGDDTEQRDGHATEQRADQHVDGGR